ncbi:MAG: hypothetical protein LUE98_00480 [Tannerellaceae bacterium]|nr:hypothetical protein [Tannerellaceae bacterium]
MNRVYLIGFLCYLTCLQIQAQTTDDSLNRTLQKISDEDSIKMNPEFMRSIQEGIFLNISPDSPEQFLFSPDLPIMKDFSEYIYSDSTKSLMPLNQLPTFVIMRQGVDVITKDLTPQSFMIHDKDLEMLRNAYYSSGPNGVGARFSMEDILRHIFWKSERAKNTTANMPMLTNFTIKCPEFYFFTM